MQLLENYKIDYFKDSVQFAMKVYNLVNGKINNIKPVGMKFIFDSNLAGFILSNGIFYLNPVSIKCETDLDKTITLDIITHELSHLNQTVDYDKYNNDEEYHKLIELENETNVYNFIMNNTNTIQKVLNFNVEKKYLDHLLWFLSL